ncbi:hypothetical protein BWQ96_05267 [Gracilariopsis chorda]|uniref:Uncharacterized protein n=1 Tax=Gracilariopsis chorda TaxID=448386 RepID=A0A2V3ITA5_9FLOR|nr:hypothetical protein BWQ96_05267 [Gracilariopsis chorda]|eukprot:PXF44967.1 hypothetical protein BWQ96_05267 [Gracilariopsis chorda]
MFSSEEAKLRFKLQLGFLLHSIHGLSEAYQPTDITQNFLRMLVLPQAGIRGFIAIDLILSRYSTKHICKQTGNPLQASSRELSLPTREIDVNEVGVMVYIS